MTPEHVVGALRDLMNLAFLGRYFHTYPGSSDSQDRLHGLFCEFEKLGVATDRKVYDKHHWGWAIDYARAREVLEAHA